jgi:hypothetical protein
MRKKFLRPFLINQSISRQIYEGRTKYGTPNIRNNREKTTLMKIYLYLDRFFSLAFFRLCSFFFISFVNLLSDLEDILDFLLCLFWKYEGLRFAVSTNYCFA